MKFVNTSVVASVIALCVIAQGALSSVPAVAQPVIPQIPGLPQIHAPELPSSPQDAINRMFPSSDFPDAGPSIPPVAQLPPDENDSLEEIQDFYAAIMPSDVGDPFFDEYPADLADYANGEIIDRRDITATAGPFVGAAVSRVEQFKFRTNSASGQPSFGTASLAIPANAWTGAGARPVVVNNVPIDSLGRKCTPGYTMAHGVSITTNPTDYIPPMTALAAMRGYAVLIPDHEGPRMAYAEPRTAGHIVLDSIRALRSLGTEFGDSPVAITGYSGGAIATNGAAKLIDSYAPDIKPSIVGAALGGTPIDYEVLTKSLPGVLNWGKGLFAAAGLGSSRENPDIFMRVNNPARQVAPIFRDLCTIPLAALGPLPIPVELLSRIEDPFNSEFAHEIYARTKLAGIAYGTPMFVYNGAQEFWIPSVMAQELYAEQCGLGTPSVLFLPFGEHLIAAVTALPELMKWIDQRLQGMPAPTGC